MNQPVTALSAQLNVKSGRPRKSGFGHEIKERKEKVIAEKTRQMIWLLQGDEGGGVASTVIDFSAQCAFTHWDVTVICEQKGSLYELLRLKGLNVISLDREKIARSLTGSAFSRVRIFVESLFSQRRSAHMINKLLKLERVDAVQCSSVLSLMMAAKVAKHFSAAALWRMSNSINDKSFLNYQRFLLRNYCSLLRVYTVGCSEYTTNSLGNYKRSFTNTHGVRTEKYSLDEVNAVTRDELKIPSDAVVFGIVARLSASGHKGQLRFLEALCQSSDDHTEHHLVLLGGPLDGPLAIKINREIQKSLGPTVHMLGNVADAERYIPIFDVSVSTTLGREPFGLSIVEAMSMERPVLAHSLGGPSEIILDGDTGWLIDDVSVEGITQGISRCLNDKRRWKEMGSAGRKLVLERFSIELEVLQWVSIVEKILSDQGKGEPNIQP